jgi:putative ABC transport system permease protein
MLSAGANAELSSYLSFTQVAFSFAVTPDLVARGLTWAMVLGLVGGLFPAIRAARRPVAEALRAA